jgi:two-component system cell cycle response regulator
MLMSARILVIEDNPTSMELMVYLLQAFSHRPLLAYDGEEGIKAAHRERPDIIICDVHLPKLDGYGVVRFLKNHPSLQSIPVVAVTALAMVGDREKVLNAGFDSYIGKPIEPQAFVNQIEEFLPACLRSSCRPGVFSPQPGTASSNKAKRATLLVIESSNAHRELIRNALEPVGYVLAFADSTRRAWEYMLSQPVELALCDLNTSRADDFGFIRRLKEEPRFADVPFVFLSSSFGGNIDIKCALELGAARLLRRPIKPQVLIGEIEACIRERERSEDGHYTHS